MKIINSQKKIFLKKEANAMFIRNKDRYNKISFKNERLTRIILDIYKKKKIKNNTRHVMINTRIIFFFK